MAYIHVFSEPDSSVQQTLRHESKDDVHRSHLVILPKKVANDSGGGFRHYIICPKPDTSDVEDDLPRCTDIMKPMCKDEVPDPSQYFATPTDTQNVVSHDNLLTFPTSPSMSSPSGLEEGSEVLLLDSDLDGSQMKIHNTSAVNEDPSLHARQADNRSLFLADLNAQPLISGEVIYDKVGTINNETALNQVDYINVITVPSEGETESTDIPVPSPASTPPPADEVTAVIVTTDAAEQVEVCKDISETGENAAPELDLQIFQVQSVGGELGAGQVELAWAQCAGLMSTQLAASVTDTQTDSLPYTYESQESFVTLMPEDGSGIALPTDTVTITIPPDAKDINTRDTLKKEKDRMQKKQKRQDPEYRAQEREAALQRMRNRRQDPLYREGERQRDRLRRRQARLQNMSLRCRERERDKTYKKMKRIQADATLTKQGLQLTTADLSGSEVMYSIEDMKGEDPAVSVVYQELEVKSESPQSYS